MRPAFAVISVVVHVAVAFGVMQAGRRPALAQEPPPPVTTPINGDTFDVGADRDLDDIDLHPTASDPTPPSPAPAPTPAPGPAPHARPASSAVASSSASASASATAPAPPAYGAVGVRYAVDLSATFAKVFPLEASKVAEWKQIPFGSAGEALVTIDITDAGAFQGVQIDGSPTPALKRGIEVTIATIRGHAFTARGARTRMRVRATVVQNDRKDDLHGNVIAFGHGATFAGAAGNGFFSIPPDRRVNVEFRLAP